MKVLVLIDETVDATAQDVASRRFGAVLDVMARQGLDPSLVTLRGWGTTNDLMKRLGHDSYSLFCPRNSMLPAAVIRLARLIRQSEADVVHSFEVIPALVGGCGGILARRGLRVFFRCHTSSEGLHAGASRMAGRLNHLTTGGTSAVIAFARDLDRTPDRKLCASLEGVVRPRVVPRAELEILRGDLGVRDGDRVVLTVARLREEKGIDVALRALALLDDAIKSRLHYVVVGSGPDEARLRGVAASVSDAQIHWIGHTDDVGQWYSLADVVVMPSLKEAFGLPAAEAMSYSRPVVASAVGGLPEIVDDGHTGILVPPGDPGRLAGALADMLLHPDLVRAMGAKAFDRYERIFTMEKMVERWIGCYKSGSRMMGQAATR